MIRHELMRMSLVVVSLDDSRTISRSIAAVVRLYDPREIIGATAIVLDGIAAERQDAPLRRVIAGVGNASSFPAAAARAGRSSHPC